MPSPAARCGCGNHIQAAARGHCPCRHAGVNQEFPIRLLTDAAAQVVDLTYREFAEWIIDRSGSVVSAQQADAIATIGLGALISARLLPNLLGTAHCGVDDNTIVETWVNALEHLLTTAKPDVST